jgi:hypothetical protein
MPPVPAIPAPLRAAHKASLKRMLAVEQAARIVMGATVAATVERAPTLRAKGTRAPAVAVETSHAIEAALATTLRQARAAARRESSATFADEFTAATGSPLPEAGERESPEHADGAAADAAAKAFAAAWLTATLEAMTADEVGDPIAAMQSAAEAQGYRLDRTAATEVARAFNDEREAIAADQAEQAAAAAAEGRGWLLLPLKVWLADLDRNTCKRCADLHGTTRPLGFAFPGDEVPGHMHPLCRCATGLLPAPIPLPANDAAIDIEEPDLLAI